MATPRALERCPQPSPTLTLAESVREVSHHHDFDSPAIPESQFNSNSNLNPNLSTNILSFPTEILTQIVLCLNKVDSLCLGLTHTRLYNAHFSAHGKTGLFEGSHYNWKKNTSWGIELHVRIEDWLKERGLRVGLVTILTEGKTGKSSSKEHIRKLVTLMEWEESERQYWEKLGFSGPGSEWSGIKFRPLPMEKRLPATCFQPRTAKSQKDLVRGEGKSKESRGLRESREPRELKELKESREPKESKESRQARESREARESKELKQSNHRPSDPPSNMFNSDVKDRGLDQQATFGRTANGDNVVKISPENGTLVGRARRTLRKVFGW